MNNTEEIFYTLKEKKQFKKIFDDYNIHPQKRHDFMREVKTMYIKEFKGMDKHLIRLEQKIKKLLKLLKKVDIKKVIKEVKVVEAFADIGNNGGIFMFDGGPVAEQYPKLLHVYHEKISSDLIPVEIRYGAPKL